LDAQAIGETAMTHVVVVVFFLKYQAAKGISTGSRPGCGVI
jgi:hypothetical protein